MPSVKMANKLSGVDAADLQLLGVGGAVLRLGEPIADVLKLGPGTADDNCIVIIKQ